MLGYPDGSFDTIFETLHNKIISAGGQVLLSQPVVKIETSDGQVTGLTSKTRTGEKVFESFDCVLSTTPSFVFPDLVELPDDYRKRLDDVHYLGALVVILEMSHPLTSYYWMNIADPDVPFLGLIEHTNMLPKEWYGGNNILYLTNYLDRTDPVYQMSQDELLEYYMPHLKKFNPAFDRSWIKNVHYNALSAAQPIIGTHYSDHIPDFRTPIKRLYLANTTQIYPEDRGTNYSVRMGREMANMIATDQKDSWKSWN